MEGELVLYAACAGLMFGLGRGAVGCSLLTTGAFAAAGAPVWALLAVVVISSIGFIELGNLGRRLYHRRTEQPRDDALERSAWRRIRLLRRALVVVLLAAEAGFVAWAIARGAFALSVDRGANPLVTLLIGEAAAVAVVVAYGVTARRLTRFEYAYTSGPETWTRCCRPGLAGLALACVTAIVFVPVSAMFLYAAGWQDSRIWVISAAIYVAPGALYAAAAQTLAHRDSRRGPQPVRQP